MNVLVCEDDLTLLRIINFTLIRNPEIIVFKAFDGIHAINLLQKRQYDLILTDISLPHFSGIDIIRYVRVHQKLDTPVIVISDDTKESTMIEAMQLGIKEYIFKPFSPMELLATINKYL